MFMRVQFVDGWLLSFSHFLEFMKRSSFLMVSMSYLWKRILPLHSAPNVDVKKVLRSFGIKKRELYEKHGLNVERYFYSKPLPDGLSA